MYLMQKCCVFCFAKNKDAALTFCWCWTFSFGKCDAEHFPLENVQHHILLCKMFSITFYFVKCSAKQNVTNAFDAKMHLMLPLHFVYKMLESGKMHFGNATQRVHFPKENVQQRCAKMHLMPKCIWCKNAFDAKMHLMLPLHFVYKMLESGKMHFGNATQRCALQKCIFASNAFDAKMHFCNASHFTK